jgi:hypothetical protein
MRTETHQLASICMPSDNLLPNGCSATSLIRKDLLLDLRESATSICMHGMNFAALICKHDEGLLLSICIHTETR